MKAPTGLPIAAGLYVAGVAVMALASESLRWLWHLIVG